MFIFDTIKPVKEEDILLETPIGIRLVSLFFTVISYVLLLINMAQDSQEKNIYSGIILIFICVNMYFLLFHRTIKLSHDKNKLIINYKFLSLIVKQSVFNLGDIEKIYHEDRRMGQIVSAKYRFFVSINNKDYNLGVVNHIDKANYIQNLFDSILKP